VRGRTEPGLAQLYHGGLAPLIVGDADRRRVLAVAQVVDQRVGRPARLVGVVAGELHHQPAVAVRKRTQRGVGQVFLVLKVDQDRVQALKLPGLVLQDPRHRVTGGGDVGVAEDHHRGVGRHLDQIQLGVQNGDEGALTSHQRPRDVEPGLRQQGIQVVAGHPARKLRVAGADLL
jgi:hypothetical protein